MAGDWPENRHQPTVSHSSMGKFQSCDRAYALQYHHSIIADVHTRFEHKKEARMQPLNCFPGSIFHETLQSALMQQRSTGEFPDLMPLANRVTAEYISFSREWVDDVRKHPILGGMHPYWPDHPFAQPVDAFYYQDFPPGFRTILKEKLTKWFDHYRVLWPELPFLSLNPSTWLFPKEVSKKAPWFVYNDDFAVYAAFDFLTKDQTIAIYDWKTGKRANGEAAVAEQLMTYAAYAVSKWKVIPESIKLYAVWVDDGSIQEVECDEWEIKRMQKMWVEHQHEWKRRLALVNGSPDKLFELFPMTNDLRSCSRCSFRSCPGRLRAPSAMHNSADSIEFCDSY